MNTPPIEDCHWEIPDKCPRCGGTIKEIDDPFILTPSYSGPKRKSAYASDSFHNFIYIQCKRRARSGYCWGAFVPDGNNIESEIVKIVLKNKIQSARLYHKIVNWHGWNSVQRRHLAYAVRRMGVRLSY